MGNERSTLTRMVYKKAYDRLPSEVLSKLNTGTDMYSDFVIKVITYRKKYRGKKKFEYLKGDTLRSSIARITLNKLRKWELIYFKANYFDSPISECEDYLINFRRS
jgi:hypothetical protein